MLGVRWYLRYGLSYRDLEELLAERGIEVDHVTLFRWAQRFTPLLVDAARPCRRAAGDRWFVDETYVKVAGQWRYLYRAIDREGTFWIRCSANNVIETPPVAYFASCWSSTDAGQVVSRPTGTLPSCERSVGSSDARRTTGQRST